VPFRAADRNGDPAIRESGENGPPRRLRGAELASTGADSDRTVGGRLGKICRADLAVA